MKLNKKQKRTATIASMAALLAVVLGMGGQTFAKYIETTSVSVEQVTVAKWGVIASTNVDNFFSDSYEGNKKAARADKNDVVAEVDAKVVAPGSSGSMTFSVTGTPEVRSKVSFAASGTDIMLSFKDNEVDKFYYPIMWTLSYDSTTVSRNKITDIADEIKKLGGVYDANTKLDKTYTLEWEWAFDSNTAPNYTDNRDAALGNFAAKKTGDDVDPNTADKETYTSAVTEFTFNLTITVEQTQADE